MREPSVVELGLPEAEGSAGSWFCSAQTRLGPALRVHKGHPKTGDPEWRNGHWGTPRPQFLHTEKVTKQTQHVLTQLGAVPKDWLTNKRS